MKFVEVNIKGVDHTMFVLRGSRLVKAPRRRLQGDRYTDLTDKGVFSSRAAAARVLTGAPAPSARAPRQKRLTCREKHPSGEYEVRYTRKCPGPRRPRQ